MIFSSKTKKNFNRQFKKIIIRIICILMIKMKKLIKKKKLFLLETSEISSQIGIGTRYVLKNIITLQQFFY